MSRPPLPNVLVRARPLRWSILTRILGVLIAVVVVSILATNFLEARLTTSALAVESRNTVRSQLRVLTSALRDREQTLDLVLRAYAERLFAQGLVQPEQRNELEADLGRMASSLRLDLLVLADEQGQPLAGTRLEAELGDLPWPPRAASFPRSRLVPVQADGYFQVVAVPVGFAGLSLVAGYDFGDGLAYALRSRLGGAGQVILVAGDQVAGSTLPDPVVDPPGSSGEAGDLPADPVAYEGSGGALLVTYSELVPAESERIRTAVGVALTDPVAPLKETLAEVRVITSLVLAVLAVALGWVLFRSITRPLVGLSKTAQRIAGGDLEAGFTAPRNDEIGRLATALQSMTSELKAATSRLQSSAKRLMAAQEGERQRLARDLHDGMQQRLVGLAIKLRRAGGAAAKPLSSDLGELATEAEDAAFALQEIGRGIYPSVLADQGLAAALRSTAGRLPMAVSVEIPPELEGVRLGPEVEGTFYFVALEAMNNVQKHAPDASLTVALDLGPDRVVLTVADDGPGFDPSTSGPGSGLQGIVDRVRALGGEATVESQPGVGTRIAFEVPVDVAAATQAVPDSRR